MKILDETSELGVVERRFDLDVAGEAVPGIHWVPAGATGPHPTVLVGHGGTQHKRVPNVLALARRLVRHLGVGVVALDAPEHGDRITDPDAARALLERLAARRREAGRGLPPMDPERMRAMQKRVPKHLAEWRALIDDLQTDERYAAGPFGWWGVSMGTHHGLPLIVEEPRITAAVLGLAGQRLVEGDRSGRLASLVTIPILFLFQWDDELMSRQSGLDLWDALGTRDKTMHINPGGHVEMPGFEYRASEEFFGRHLLAATPEPAQA
jgi:dienelactone hydrolase